MRSMQEMTTNRGVPEDSTWTRRQWLRTAGGAALGCAAASATGTIPAAEQTPAGNPLPRWRGFNLLNFFQALGSRNRNDGMILEDDFRWIRRDWGFDLSRIPMDYWLWIDSDWQQTRTMKPDDVFKIKESLLEPMDRTVELGRKHTVHVSLNFHRAPGYCINEPGAEQSVLWRDAKAEDAFVHHWEVFSYRYRDDAVQRVEF